MSTAGFRFGLERVRALRAHDEDRAKEAFASSLAQRMRGAALLAAASEAVDAAHAARRDGAGEATGRDLVSMQAWMERVEQSRRDAERALAEHDDELSSRRTELTEASRRRQALEKLKERRAAEHRLDASRREGAALDEIALSAHVRRAGSKVTELRPRPRGLGDHGFGGEAA